MKFQVSFDVRLFQHMDYVISKGYRIRERAERYGVFHHSRHPVEIRHSSQADDQVIKRNLHGFGGGNRD